MFKNHKTVIIILLSLFLGTLGGVTGSILARVYLLEDAFDVPFVGEISLNNRQAGSSLIFSNAKKVVVEQNQKIAEAADSGAASLVGIYKKIKMDEKTAVIKTAPKAATSSFNISGSYRINQFARQGFIITSDGWIITDFAPDDITQLLKSPKSSSTVLEMKSVLDEYFVLDADRDQYPIEDIVFDELSGYAFWKIKAMDLTVKKLVPLEEIKNGQIALAINLDGWVMPATVVGLRKDKNLVKSSDRYDPGIILSENMSDVFQSSFLLDLNGDLLGVINSKGDAKPIGSLVGCIKCLFKSKSIERSVFGVSYVNLSDLIDLNLPAKQQNGALISENEKGIAVLSKSPASIAGLKAGDIILAINGRQINQDTDLAFLINQSVPGDVVDVEYMRDSLRQIKKIVLSD